MSQQCFHWQQILPKLNEKELPKSVFEAFQTEVVKMILTEWFLRVGFICGRK